MMTQRWPPQEACCALQLIRSQKCLHDRKRRLGVVSDGDAIAHAAAGDVLKSPGSHAIVVSNRACMPPQRWPTQELVAFPAHALPALSE